MREKLLNRKGTELRKELMANCRHIRITDKVYFMCEAVMILVAKMYTVELILYPEKTSGALEDNSKIYFIREIIDQNSALHD